MSDMFGFQPLVSLNVYSTQLPSCASTSTSHYGSESGGGCFDEFVDLDAVVDEGRTESEVESVRDDDTLRGYRYR